MTDKLSSLSEKTSLIFLVSQADQQKEWKIKNKSDIARPHITSSDIRSQYFF